MGEIRVGITGCGGRMGRMLVAGVLGSAGLTLAGGSEAPGSAVLGRDIGELAGSGALGLAASADAAALFAAADVVIDFTAPAPAAAHATLAAQHGKALVLGTTGLDPTQTKAVAAAAKRVPIVWAPNMSPAVTLLMGLVEEAARRLGEDYDIEVLEGDIGFASLRGGDVVGDHTVIFAGEGERLELTHRASSRRLFARGALRAARWVVGKEPGLYGMKDVLGL